MGKRYGETEKSSLIKSDLTFSQQERAIRASVSDSLPGLADAIYEFGDQAVLQQVHDGHLTVTDAYRVVNRARKAKQKSEREKSDG